MYSNKMIIINVLKERIFGAVRIFV